MVFQRINAIGRRNSRTKSDYGPNRRGGMTDANPKKSQPFKEFVNKRTVARLAQGFAATGSFDVDGFMRAATDGLANLELKARVRQVAAALRQALPKSWPAAVDRLVRALPKPLTGTEEVSTGLSLWPLTQLVEDFGVEEPEVSLAALPELTKRSTAEFAVRPFIARYPTLAFASLHRWARDDNVHVRRLASEGSRPRLPWGLRLKALVADPTPTLALLEQLKDDPELYVRRSVANHLNDISKDHPDLAVEVAKRWHAGANANRRWVVQHALRGLIKAGHPGALALMGFHPPRLGEIALTCPSAVRVGEYLDLALTLRSLQAQALLIDYAVHRRLKNGKLSRKVFKWIQRQATPDQVITVSKRHSFKPVTTRVYYPGQHRIDVLVNGQNIASAGFVLHLAIS